jgi:23S rRNA pseudouridine1911/1915/1917 synthase
MPQGKMEFEVLAGEGERIDVFLAKKFGSDTSRSRIQEWIREGAVFVNDRVPKPHYKVRTGDRITVEACQPAAMEAREEDIPLTILHEDQDLLLVNKPAGMVVHPAHGNPEHTLVNALLYHTRRGLSSGEAVRPGIVHRLDKETSGLLVVAKNDFAHRFLAKQFKTHQVIKLYEAIVSGVVQHDELECSESVGRSFMNRKMVMVKPSGGKNAFTFFRVIERFPQATRIEARPLTGRTHQIRVHLAHLGHPVLGDLLYGGKSPWIARHALHAKSLEFTHPRTRERMKFSCELAEDMRQLIKELKA